MKTITLALLLAASGVTLAQSIYDPTQPKKLYIVQDQTVSDDDMLDPFQRLQLQGILTKKGMKTAFISGQLYYRGDTVEGYKIREIHKDYVVLVSSGTQKRLYVYE